MKTTRSLQLAALLALSSGSLLSAATYSLHITGPTSYRASATNAIANVLTNPVASYSGTNLSLSTTATFTGTIGADTWNIYTYWTGSENAVRATAQASTPYPTFPFLALSNPQSVVIKATAPLVVSGGTSIASPVFDNARPEATLSDAYQASTQYKGTKAGVTYNALVGPTIPGLPPTVIAVQPYEIIASARDSAGNSYTPATYTGKLTTTAGSLNATLSAAIPGLKDGAIIDNPNLRAVTAIQSINGKNVVLSQPALVSGKAIASSFEYNGLSNLSSQLARKTFQTGSAKLSQYTGSNADAGVTVYAIGRSHDAGARAGFVLEAGLDKPGTSVTSLQQYYPLDIDGNVIGLPGAGTTIADVELVPSEKVNGVVYTVGQSGYSSGTLLTKPFLATNGLANSLFISYIGVSDANTAVEKGNAQKVAYNGFYYTAPAVQQGQYTLWDYEHIYYLSSIPAKLKGTVNLIAKQIAVSDGAVAGVLIDANFKAVRTPVAIDGAIVTR